ncbi:hypothetical protein COV06_01225 [Candidatus Uhrbacteria bacterium CG10_big_fil_rev_8_21_14_0_10_50_16]|uniref:Uncharacterized protein n=1 Tax=Candidatus Uhrbacteria bacterium CG10_big_fil_rev_8_21_14_0_10_50_16 TaxID=1975039 RepID=A0A2H0RNC0_9BACT|nr:MAG: hypothetical protein COV06_01225 [Candidatus Uhrbacteria bacterium CG10_big_fil_rev_8_21_14_0_10_50_16]
MRSANTVETGEERDWRKNEEEGRKLAGWVDVRLRNGRVQHEVVQDLIDTGVGREVAGWALAIAIRNNGGKPPEVLPHVTA